VPTHFKRQATARIIHVKEFSIPGREPLSGKTHGRVLPVEWIWRARVFGSLWKRIEEGRVSPVSLGFEKETTVTKGMKLPSLMLECTTKFEEVDRHLSDEEAKDLAELTNEQFDEARQLVVQAVALTNARYEKAGFMCPDGKLELGMLDNGKPILVDVFGTPDENRIIDRKTGELYSKDLIRNYLDDTPWKKELEKAKARHPHGKGKWPAYPVLPHDFLYLVGMRYCAVAKRYAAAT
jgi:phosphoribosylaminoimidazole-succinocarboxamide synthase